MPLEKMYHGIQVNPLRLSEEPVPVAVVQRQFGDPSKKNLSPTALI